MRFAKVLAVSFLLLPSILAAGERWALQYHYDEADSELRLFDVAFCSERRGVASGAVVKQRGKPKGAVLVTSDGGQNWTLSNQRDIGTNLFFLSDCSGWMVGQNGIWYTQEGGRDWRRISKERVEEVYFLDAKHGFAVGDRKRVLETFDGGESWTELEVAKELDLDEDRTTFRAIDFVGQRALIIGNVDRPQSWSDRTPIWMDTDPQLRRERPSLMAVLTSPNGGKTWETQTSSVFGAVTEISFDESGRGLLLIRFSDYFEYPSEVFRAEADKNINLRTLRRKDFAATDVAVTTGGPAYVAGRRSRGLLPSTPIPEEVQIMKSSDLNLWVPMEVDYRAVAREVNLALWGTNNAWAVTDTGMVLRLVQD